MAMFGYIMREKVGWDGWVGIKLPLRNAVLVKVCIFGTWKDYERLWLLAVTK